MKYCAICDKPIYGTRGRFCNKHYREFFLPYRNTAWMKFLDSSTMKYHRLEVIISKHEVPLEEYEYED